MDPTTLSGINEIIVFNIMDLEMFKGFFSEWSQHRNFFYDFIFIDNYCFLFHIPWTDCEKRALHLWRKNELYSEKNPFGVLSCIDFCQSIVKHFFCSSLLIDPHIIPICIEIPKSELICNIIGCNVSEKAFIKLLFIRILLKISFIYTWDSRIHNVIVKQVKRRL